MTPMPWFPHAVRCLQSGPKDRERRSQGLSKGTLENPYGLSESTKGVPSRKGGASATRSRVSTHKVGCPLWETEHLQGTRWVTWSTRPHTPWACNLALRCETWCPCHGPRRFAKVFFDGPHTLGTQASDHHPQGSQAAPRPHSHGLALFP